MSSQEAKYLVIETGYEGISDVFGMFNQEDAISFLIKKRSMAELRRVLRDKYEQLEREVITTYEIKGFSPTEAFDKMKEDPQMVSFVTLNSQIMDSLGPTDPDFYCVSTISPEGTHCVCENLGVKPSKNMLR